MTDLFTGNLENGGPPRTRSERRRMERRKAERRRNIISFIIMVCALILLAGGGWFFIKPMLDEVGTTEPTDYPGPGTGATEIVVSDGDTGKSIGTTLVDAGVVKTMDAFIAAYESNPSATSIQSGTYELPLEMKAVDAVAALLDSSYRVDVRITVPEGWTAEQVYERVSDSMGVSVEEVEDASEKVGESLPKSAKRDLEGWLAPSTYTVTPDEDVEDVLAEMVRRTEQVLDDHEVDRSDQQDVIIKASIVEKEVPKKYRAQVARVIENRLDGCSGDETLGMDTTMVYAFGKQYSEISQEERESSRYNTRIHPGLPPTPIGSPSIDSIEAVLDPAKGNWCYFVTINLETEETLFTDDLDEHNKNQAKYREYLEELRAENNDED